MKFDFGGAGSSVAPMSFDFGGSSAVEFNFGENSDSKPLDFSFGAGGGGFEAPASSSSGFGNIGFDAESGFGAKKEESGEKTGEESGEIDEEIGFGDLSGKPLFEVEEVKVSTNGEEDEIQTFPVT